MDVTKPPQKTREDHLQEIIFDHNNCCLCGSALQFKHETDFLKLEVKEEAFCMSCQVRTKAQTSTLQ